MNTIDPSADFLTAIIRRGERQGHDIGIRYLDELGDCADEITYAELSDGARRVAATLREEGVAGLPVVLLTGARRSFAVWLLGCMLAGSVAVPAPRPRGSRQQERLRRLVQDSGAVAIVGPPSADPIEVPGVQWWTPDCYLGYEPSDVPAVSEAPEQAAILQYTSGSTAAPRGVVLTHVSLGHNIGQIASAFDLSPESKAVIWLPTHHDMGLIGGLLTPLSIGFPVTLLEPRHFARQPIEWLRAISREQATVSGGPNSAYDMVARGLANLAPDDAVLDLSRWRTAFVGAEPIHPETMRRFLKATAPFGFGAAALRPCYGLAEATLMVTATRGGDIGTTRRPGDEKEIVDCGPPVADTEVVIADNTGRALPPGRVGRILVRGPGVAAGYRSNTEETERVFGATVRGRAGVFLDTGDLGFLDSAGCLFPTGRTKEVLIVNGRNIYPSDLELAAATAAGSALAGAAAAFGLGVMDEFAVAVECAAPESEHAALVQRIRLAVFDEAQHAPAVIALVPTGSLPRTTSGKIQRGRTRTAYLAGGLAPFAESDTRLSRTTPGVHEQLLRTELARATPAARVRLLVSYLEDRLAAAGVVAAATDTESSLISHGLDSLTLVSILSGLEAAVGQPLSRSTLLSLSSIEAVAAAAADTGRSETPVRPAPLPGAEYGTWSAASPAESAMFVLESLLPGGTNLWGAWEVTGPCDAGLVESALATLVDRHDALRTSYRDSPSGVQRRVQPPTTCPPDVVSIAAAHWSEARVEDWLRTTTRLPFDIAEAPLLRGYVHELGDDRHLLLVTVSHLVADFRSTTLLFDELVAELNQPGSAPPVELGYASHVPAAHAYLDSERGRREVADSVRELSGVSSRLLPSVAGAADRVPVGAAAEMPIVVPADAVDALTALARLEQTTLFVVMLATYQAALHCCTQQGEVVVGTPVLGRESRFGASVGLFMNQAPIISRLDGHGTFRELVRATRERVLAALDREHCPLTAVTAALGRNAAVFETMFVLQQPAHQLALGEVVDGARVRIGDLTFRSRYVPRSLDTLPLTLVGAEYEGTLRFVLRYLCDRVSPDIARHIADTFVALARRLAEDPDAPVLSILSPPVAHTPSSWRGAPARRKESVVDRLRDVVGTYPDVVAVDDTVTTLTYAELWERAGRAAAMLRSQGVRPSGTVLILCRRNADAVVATIAVLRAGAAYVHLDADSPIERLRRIAVDSGAAVMVAETALAPAARALGVRMLTPDDLRTGGPGQELLEIPAELPAYISYTSGSSGSPKGVLVAHHAVVAAVDAYTDRLAIGPGDVVCGVSALGWDIVVGDIHAGLLRGATLCLAPADVVVDPVDLVALLAARRISVLATTPHRWRLLLDAGFRPSAGFRAVCGGDTMPPALAADFRRLGVHVWNFYGPTETVLWATCNDLWRRGGAESASVPIGVALDGYELHVVDPAMRPVPPGVPGELCIGGPTVAEGYLGAAAQTAERFVPDPFAATPGARVYRTGDIVRHGPGGLTFHGRADLQLKIRGHRVEAGEIESALVAIPSVSAAAVVAADTELVAYVQRVAGAPTGGAELIGTVGSTLPRYMVPDRVIEVDELPVTVNGKVDRVRLAEMVPEYALSARPVEHQPATVTERLVADIFREVLGAEVDVQDDFFAVGGHSLRAVQVAARLSMAIGRQVSVRAIFAYPTVAGIADYLDRVDGVHGFTATAPSERAEGRPGALTSGQYRVWYEQLVAEGDVGLVLPFGIELSGTIVHGAAVEAFDYLVDRHESLRTVVVEEGGEPRLSLGPRPELSVVRAPGMSLGDVREALAVLTGEPWRVDEGPLIRSELHLIDEDRAFLLVAVHHLISDGWSARVLLNEFLTVYADLVAGREPRLPRLVVGEHDAARRRAAATELVTSHTVRRVADRLQDAPRIALPTVTARRTDGAARRYSVEAGALVHRIARRRRTTAVAVVAAALGMALSSRCRQEDLVLWLDVANRDHPDLEHLVGYFGNQIPMRLQIRTTDDLGSVLDRAGGALRDALEDADAPYEQVLAELRRRSGGAVVGDLVDVKVVHQFMPRRITSGDSSIVGTLVDSGWASAADPVGLWIWDDGEACRLEVHYRPESCSAEWAEALLDAVVATLHTELRLDRGGRPAFSEVTVAPIGIGDRPHRSIDVCVDSSRETSVLTVESDGITDPQSWLAEHRDVVVGGLNDHGAVLLRGFDVATPDALTAVTTVLYEKNYATAEHPRQVIDGQVVTPVDYPPELELFWHNEDSFNRIWPATLAFACARAADEGGETTVVDGVHVWKMLRPGVRAEFQEKGVRYIRRFIPGLGLPWTTVFATENRAEVERRCAADGMSWTWEHDILTTVAHRPAVMSTQGEQAWFAQILHWHEACIDPETREAMRAGLGGLLPRSVTFGDGSPISDDIVDELIDVCRASEYPMRWQPGDVLFVNNRRAAHGRRPYRGSRKILVALGDPVEE